MLAAIRADIHNTAGKSFNTHFTPDDFLGTTADLEERVNRLVASGYTKSEAVALATSKQSSAHKLQVIDGAMRQAHEQKRKPKRKAPWRTK